MKTIEIKANKKRAKKFVRLLADGMKSGGLSAKRKKAKKYFKTALTNLPDGDIKNLLNQDFNEYLDLLIKRHGSQEEITESQESTKETAEHNNKKNSQKKRKPDGDNSAPSKKKLTPIDKPISFSYNLYLRGKKAKKVDPSVANFVDACRCLLGENIVLMRKKQMRAILDALLNNAETETSWMQELQFLCDALAGNNSALGLKKVMTHLNSNLMEVSDSFINLGRKKKAKVRDVLHKALQFFHFKLASSKGDFGEPKYGDLIAAILSVYFDLVASIAQVSQPEETERAPNSLFSFSVLLLQPNLHFLYDVILQQSDVDSSSLHLFKPILRHCLLTPRDVGDVCNYTKYMCAYKRIVSWSSDSEHMVEEFRKAALSVDAPPSYFKWAQSQDNEIFDDTPLNDNSSGSHITRFLVDEAPSKLLESLLDFLTSETSVDGAENEEPAEHVHQLSQGTSGTVDNAGGLFFIDKKADKNTVLPEGTVTDGGDIEVYDFTNADIEKELAEMTNAEASDSDEASDDSEEPEDDEERDESEDEEPRGESLIEEDEEDVAGGAEEEEIEDSAKSRRKSNPYIYSGKDEEEEEDDESDDSFINDEESGEDSDEASVEETGESTEPKQSIKSPNLEECTPNGKRRKAQRVIVSDEEDTQSPAKSPKRTFKLIITSEEEDVSEEDGGDKNRQKSPMKKKKEENKSDMEISQSPKKLDHKTSDVSSSRSPKKSPIKSPKGREGKNFEASPLTSPKRRASTRISVSDDRKTDDQVNAGVQKKSPKKSPKSATKSITPDEPEKSLSKSPSSKSPQRPSGEAKEDSHPDSDERRSPKKKWLRDSLNSKEISSIDKTGVESNDGESEKDIVSPRRTRSKLKGDSGIDSLSGTPTRSGRTPVPKTKNATPSSVAKVTLNKTPSLLQSQHSKKATPLITAMKAERNVFDFSSDVETPVTLRQRLKSKANLTSKTLLPDHPRTPIGTMARKRPAPQLLAKELPALRRSRRISDSELSSDDIGPVGTPKKRTPSKVGTPSTARTASKINTPSKVGTPSKAGTPKVGTPSKMGTPSKEAGSSGSKPVTRRRSVLQGETDGGTPSNRRRSLRLA